LGIDAARLGRFAARAWAAALLCCLAALAPMRASGQDRGAAATDVEAAYLVNFLRYTQWPAERLPSPDAPLVLTVVGPEQVADRVRAVAAAAGPVGSHPIVVRSLAVPRGSLEAPLGSDRDREAAQLMRASHLVFFHEDAAFVHPQVFADLWGQPVLTVGNARGFTGRGGMLGLFRSGGNILFEANPGAIRNSGLVVSAKVLKLARTAR